MQLKINGSHNETHKNESKNDNHKNELMIDK